MSRKERAALMFMWLLVRNGAKIEPRNPDWLDYAEPENIFATVTNKTDSYGSEGRAR